MNRSLTTKGPPPHIAKLQESQLKVPTPVLISVNLPEKTLTADGKYNYPLNIVIEKAFQDAAYSLFMARGSLGGYFYRVDINVPKSNLVIIKDKVSFNLQMDSKLISPDGRELENISFKGKAKGTFNKKERNVPSVVWDVCYQAAKEYLESIQKSKWISGYLTDAGYRCAVASDGNTAIERVARIKPGVILLDVKMPGMDGFEVCRWLKQNETTRDIPVIFLTVLDDIESKRLGFGAGGVDYITKPVQKEELLARVGTHLENYLYKNKLEQANKRLSEEIDRHTETGENLRITLNSIGDGVIATDTKGCIVRMNPVAEELTGWQFKAANGKPLTKVFNIVNARTGEKADNPVKKVIKSGKIVRLANHIKLIAKDGAEYQIADSAAPIQNIEGNVTGVVLIFRDVSEARYLSLAEASFEGLLVHDRGRVIDVNTRFQEMFGYKAKNSHPNLAGRSSTYFISCTSG